MTQILIDAYNIARPHGTGVATYGRNLARAAADLGHDINLLFGNRAGHSKQPLLNEIALAQGDDPLAKEGKRKALALPRQVATAAGGIFAARQAREIAISGEVILPNALKMSGARYWNAPQLYNLAHGAFKVTGRPTNVTVPGVDIAHWTYPLPIKMPGATNIYTLHDLVPLRLPYTTADRKKTYLALCQRIAREADHILTVSEHSRADIIRILGVEDSRVTNLYQSSDMENYLADESSEDIQRYVEGLLGRGFREYFLFFGAIEPKKNIARLMEAYMSSGAKASLVIVGAPGWGSNEDVKLLKSMANLDKRKRIIWLNYLPRKMLAMVISGARATIFPSLYEGFGLPVLESMMLGTPVITSNVSSLPEVTGDAAILIDPYSVSSLGTAIKQLDNDEGLLDSLARRGREQSIKFSHDAYADRLRNFYLKF